MYIGNIVSSNKINVGLEFNVVSTCDERIEGLPTLIVGYDEAIECSPDNKVNVLHRSIDSETLWTFKRIDNRMLFDHDVEDFIRFAYKNSVSKLRFFDIDLIQDSKKRLFNIVRKVLSLNDFITYESDNNIIYMLSNDLIFGFDLNTARYTGLDIEKIKLKIKEISKVYLYGNEPLIEFGDDLVRLDNDIKLLPYLYSVNPLE